MAIQAHIHQENFGSLPISSQDYFFTGNDNFINNTTYNNTDLQYKLLQQQQFQQQQQYMVHFQNMKKRDFCDSNNNNSFVFLQLSKKQKLAANPTTTNTTATTTSTTTSENDNQMSLSVSKSLSEQLEKQGHEIDRLIVLQNERLKLALQEQRKQQLRLIMKNLEAKAMRLLKQKDNEIAFATKKIIELQEIMRKMEVENQTWQSIASQNEAMVFSLSNTLEQLQQQLRQQQQQQQSCSSSSSNVVDDVESCCDFLDNNEKRNTRKVETYEGLVAETGENRGVFGFQNEKPTKTTRGLLLCKVCNSRNANVLLLPCRHMCCCKVCDELVHVCPLCKSSKMASIEALFS
ncbi:hypothetical protein RND81_09G151600 [Saponaria officinalis]|uniref:RING-type domain-containing protein n=1 Tax=Saponaria officinalis TaxID=3572 RepID=A0AAW1IKY2_SAPOF